MPHLPSAHHETSKHDSLNETKVKEKQNETISDSNSNLAKSMTHHNQTKELTTWFLNDMSAKVVEHNEKSANLEKVRQNCDLADACQENNYFKANLDGSHIDVSLPISLHNDMSDKDCDFCLVVMEDPAKL
jgi:hypothetical protein